MNKENEIKRLRDKTKYFEAEMQRRDERAHDEIARLRKENEFLSNANKSYRAQMIDVGIMPYLDRMTEQQAEIERLRAAIKDRDSKIKNLQREVDYWWAYHRERLSG
jgi:hypothetical protein